MTRRPTPAETAPYYARYVAAVPDGDLFATLSEDVEAWATLLDGADPDHAYAPGKWTVRQVVQHVIDTERVFAYRALRFGRGDATALPGFDQDAFAETVADSPRSLADLTDELRAVRASTVALLRSLPEAAWDRIGTASGLPMSTRGAAWVIAGHALHHRAVLRDRYELA